MKRRESRTLSNEEKELWEKVRQSTVPLQDSATAAIKESVRKLSAPAPRISLQPFEIGQNSRQSIVQSIAPSTSQVSMDSKKYGHLKKGKLKPDARIDLHGLTLSQAHPALIGFILNAYQNADRLVLVITGKGKPRADPGIFPSQTGLLRQHVPRWLQEYPIVPHILQTRVAHTKHGGEGALYVYLRRNK